jgi:hypothetical protein
MHGVLTAEDIERLKKDAYAGQDILSESGTNGGNGHDVVDVSFEEKHDI